MTGITPNFAEQHKTNGSLHVLPAHEPTREGERPQQTVESFTAPLGGGVATDLASRRPFRVLVLASTFTSFPDLAQQLYPFFPGRWLVRNQFRNIDKRRSRKF